MAACADSKKPSSGPADAPTAETFWTRYSPHHECLLSWVGSATGHGLVLGILFLSGLAIGWARTSEVRRPPTMDVVQLEGGGQEGGGGDPAPFGQEHIGKEAAVEQVKEKVALVPPDKFQEIKPRALDVPAAPTLEPAASDDIFASLNKSIVEVNRDPPKPAVKQPKIASTIGSSKGVVDGKGRGGLGGGGDGTGRGKGVGPGLGGPGGRKLTRQDILAWRWRFDMSGDGKEHADKLSAIGVILVVPDPAGKPLVIRDLKRRPVEALPEDISKFKDAVRWLNRKPDSVFILAKELQLPFVPDRVELYLPRDREEKISEVEQRFARRLSRPMQNVRATWFDFQLRNGVYEPVVIRQE